MPPRKPKDTPEQPPAKRPEGRPTKLTKQLQQQLCNLLELGNYFEPACYSLGIVPETAYNWLRLAKDDHPEGQYREFSDAIARASAQGEINMQALIAEAASGGSKGDYRAALEILRRRWAGRWGDTQKIKIDSGEVERLTAQVLQVVRESIESSITDPQLRKRTLAAVLDGLAGIAGAGAEGAARS